MAYYFNISSFRYLDICFCMKFSKNNHSPYGLIGDEGIRTPDPLLARQVLSQLSYTPVFRN